MVDLSIQALFGFRAGLSTTDAVVNFLDVVYDCIINENKGVVTDFLNFSKAFDTIYHDIFIKKTLPISYQRQCKPIVPVIS